MGEAFPFLDIIIFAIIAAFLVMRLRSVLGRRTGHERRPPKDAYTAKKVEGKEAGDDTVVQLPEREAAEARRGAVEADDPLAAGLTQIRIADRNFDVEKFCAGSRTAFEMVVTSYAAGDTDTLKPLLSKDVFDNFARAITEREGKGHVLETTLVGIRSADVIEASMSDSTAVIAIKFVSEQINVTRDVDDEVVDGDASRVTSVTDIWTFARDAKSRNPNWTLIATDAPN